LMILKQRLEKSGNWIEVGDWGLDDDDIKKWTKKSAKSQGQHQISLYRTNSGELFIEFRLGHQPRKDIGNKSYFDMSSFMQNDADYDWHTLMWDEAI